MNPGRVVEYFDNDRIVCGLIVESKGNRLRLLTEEDREATLSPNRVLHCSSYSINVGVPRQERVRKLKEIAAKQEKLKKKIEAREIWELLKETKGTVDDQVLTEVVFGKETTSDHIAALWRSIFEDRLHFKIKGKQFLVHTPEQVARLKLKREREAERERELEEASRWFHAIWEGKAAGKPKKAGHYIGLLKEHAVFGKEAPRYPQIQETLRRAGLTAQDASFRLLVKTGVWDEDENLLLHRYQISTDWSEELLGEAQAIASRSHMKGEERRDLTKLSTFSIDSESARDIDDALSFERVENGFRVGIHITDVAHFIPLDSLLNEEASERLTSIYLPEGKIPMLPPLLSENILSLLPGEERLAVSMFVHLDEGGEIRASETFLSRIKIHRRLTYEEVDVLL
jgi:exoribonuclease-2